MDDETAAETPPVPAKENERVVRGRLIQAGPDVIARPPEADAAWPGAPAEESADSDEVAAHPPSEDIRAVNGSPTWVVIGLVLLAMGAAIYLYGLWASANAVLAGETNPEQRISLFGLRWLVGNIGLTLATLGAIVAVTFIFVPLRNEPVVTAGSLPYRVLVENLRGARKVALVFNWIGGGLLGAGTLLVVLVFRWTIQGGELWTLSLGGVGYRVHLVGYVAIVLGTILVLTMGPRLRAVEHGLEVAAAHERPTHGHGGMDHGNESALEAERGLPAVSKQSVPDGPDHGVESTHAGWR